MSRQGALGRAVATACALGAALLLPRPGRPCTAFLLDTGGLRLVAKAYDWDMGQGLVVVNPRGVEKEALALRPGDRPARWTSRYASVTFNQYGRELPNGGINEAGLVVEVLWLDASQLPPPDGRPTVNELQWIQAQLDRFATIEELARAAHELRVSMVHGKVHYFACDRGGACAVIEHLDGKTVVFRGIDLPVRALANDPYPASLAARDRARGLGSLGRFAQASRAGASATGGDPVRRAFQTLNEVSGSRTQWRIVYDPAALTVQLETQARHSRRWFDARALMARARCGVPARVYDLEADDVGDVTGRFQPDDGTRNRRLVERSAAPISRRLPPGAIEGVAAYPTRLSCATP